MSLYNFEKSIDTIDRDHVYFKLFLGKEYTYDNINSYNCGFMTDEAMELIEDIFLDFNSDYDHWGITRYDESQIKGIERKLLERLEKLNNNCTINILRNNWFSDDWREILQNIYTENRNELIIFFSKIVEWFGQIKEKNLIVIGI